MRTILMCASQVQWSVSVGKQLCKRFGEGFQKLGDLVNHGAAGWTEVSRRLLATSRLAWGFLVLHFPRIRSVTFNLVASALSFSLVLTTTLLNIIPLATLVAGFCYIGRLCHWLEPKKKCRRGDEVATGSLVGHGSVSIDIFVVSVFRL